MCKLLLSFLLVMVIASCSKNDSEQDKRTLAYFTVHLKADMTYSAIENAFGKPDADTGSGIHIYVYKLTDDTEIWIGYTDLILYARQVNKNREVLHILI